MNEQAHEVELTGKAADINWKMVSSGGDNWIMTVEGVVEPLTPDGRFDKTETQRFILTNDQASATLALFIGELSDSELSNALYELAEQVWKGVPSHFRPIP